MQMRTRSVKRLGLAACAIIFFGSFARSLTHDVLASPCQCLAEKLKEILPDDSHKPNASPATSFEVPKYTTTDDIDTLLKRRKESPSELHLLIRSNDQSGLVSLAKTPTSVTVMIHALPTNRASAISLHGAVEGANVPIRDLNLFLKKLDQSGAVIAPISSSPGDEAVSLKIQLITALKAQPADTAVVIPGHIVGSELKLPDKTSISLNDLAAANPRVMLALAGCDSATTTVVGEAVIGTGAKLTYRQAMRLTSSLQKGMARMPLGEALLRLQKAGPYIGLVGLAFVVTPLGNEKKRY
jgi:hypothetical protein